MVEERELLLAENRNKYSNDNTCQNFCPKYTENEKAILRLPDEKSAGEADSEKRNSQRPVERENGAHGSIKGKYYTSKLQSDSTNPYF